MTDSDKLLAVVTTLQNDDLHRFIKSVLHTAPAEFWVIPTSSTGKYHPKQSNGEGGLIRHTLAAVYMAQELFMAYPGLSPDDQEVVLAAVIVHDIGKAKAEPHDVVGANMLYRLSKGFTSPLIQDVIQCVRWHMGRWATGSTDCPQHERGTKVFPMDFSITEQITHLADYFAARKRLILEDEE